MTYSLWERLVFRFTGRWPASVVARRLAEVDAWPRLRSNVDDLHGVTNWTCQNCGEVAGPFSATAPIPTCPRCHGLNWATAPKEVQRG